MTKYRKKPVVIEAHRVPFLDELPSDELFEFLAEGHLDFDDAGCVPIKTLEGTMLAQRGDWIIKGVEGEYYPCKNSVFEATYDPD